jgi:2-iminoacetate synthase ThiH
MFIGISSIACIVIFVVCAFLLRERMSTLCAIYEAQSKAMHAAEIVLLSQGTRPNVQQIERDVREAAANSQVMRRNAGLFRLLWPNEYDRAFYAGERLIAQSSRLLALTTR